MPEKKKKDPPRKRPGPESPHARDLSTFCVLPFSHLFANEYGEMYFCCMAVESRLPVRDEGGVPYSFRQPERIVEAWNSPFMRQARLDLMNGKKPAPCQRCFKTEELHETSSRANNNNRYFHHISRMLDQVRPDGSMDFHPLSVDIRLGNLCNLRCRMCSPIASRALLREWKEIYPALTAGLEPKLSNSRWYQSPQFWDLMERHLDGIVNFHFAGGEPFLAPELVAFLERIQRTGKAGEKYLTFNTNGTLLPPELLRLWPSFKGVSVYMSVDGMEAMNTYIRHPARWDQIVAHLDQLDHLAGSTNYLDARICSTVQAYNIFDLPNLLRWVIPRYRHIQYPFLSLLFEPAHLSAQALPPALRAEARILWRDFHASFRSEIDRHTSDFRDALRLHQEIEGLIEFLAQPGGEREFPEFLRATHALDRSRGQRLAEVAPRFNAYLN